MMASSFVQKINKFNTVMFAVLIVLGIGVLLFSGFIIYKQTNRFAAKNEIVNINPEEKNYFRLGTMKEINGSDSALIPLFSDQGFRGFSSGPKYATSTRNILFLNVEDQSILGYCKTIKA